MRLLLKQIQSVRGRRSVCRVHNVYATLVCRDVILELYGFYRKGSLHPGDEDKYIVVINIVSLTFTFINYYTYYSMIYMFCKPREMWYYSGCVGGQSTNLSLHKMKIQYDNNQPEYYCYY